MTEKTEVWTEVRDDAIREFGVVPTDEQERVLLARWLKEPKLVSRAIDSVVLGVHDKTIRNPWALVDLNTRNALSKLGSQNDEDRKAQAVARCESWTRESGWRYPFYGFDDELFGGRGKLRRYRSDTQLRAHFKDLWRSLQAEAEQEQSSPTESKA